MKPGINDILKLWSTVIPDGLDHSEDLRQDIYDRLELVEAPNFSSLVDADTIVSENRRFSEYRIVVRVWSAGTHICVSLSAVCRPGWFKRLYSRLVVGDPSELYLLTDLGQEQEFTSWYQVVEACVRVSVKQLEDKLRGTGEIQRDKPGIW
jgi:hypothetical protein